MYIRICKAIVPTYVLYNENSKHDLTLILRKGLFTRTKKSCHVMPHDIGTDTFGPIFVAQHRTTRRNLKITFLVSRTYNKWHFFQILMTTTSAARINAVPRCLASTLCYR
jgi:hypothetical protein